MPGGTAVIASTPNQLVGMKEASQYIGLKPATLYRLVKKGAIRYVLIDDRPGHNHRLHFRRCDLDAYVESRVRGGPSPKPEPLKPGGPLRMPERREFS